MNKVISCPRSLLPSAVGSNAICFCQYERPGDPCVGWFGKELPRELRSKGFQVDDLVWDFSSIALSVAAADYAIPRKRSSDGWTREIDLLVYVHNPLIWSGVADKFNKMLKFLTGDLWRVSFALGGADLPKCPMRKTRNEYSPQYMNSDSVALLSGGMDSLVGCIDLVSNGHKPIFVSHRVNANTERQQNFARAISPSAPLMQWSRAINYPGGDTEPSTRGRSIVFFAFAALAACAIRRSGFEDVPIYVSENGFISLNVGLNPGRIGSLSTKTTHPVYMRQLQEIWDKVGIRCRLILPYKFKTKGEMVAECGDQKLLRALINDSTSCSRYGTHGRRHCGRCVPCAVRAAAYLKAGVDDKTDYKYRDEGFRRKSGADDIGALMGACLRMNSSDFESIIAGDFLFACADEKPKYKAVFIRGLQEVDAYLRIEGYYDRPSRSS